MPSENYRYYCLDRVGRLYGAERFRAERDAEAITHIKAKHPDRIGEIWLRKRSVARLSPMRRSA